MAYKPPISGSKTKNTKLKSVKVEIPVKNEPTPRYTPGSGPPLQRPKLFNRRDSTAYIIDRVFRPAGLAKDGLELPKQVMYFIGWRDLPAATHMVPAMDVLDYVSPTELEEWESKTQDDLDERVESAKLQKKEGKAVQAQTGKRKRGPGADSGIEGTIATLQQPEEREDQEHDKRRGAPMSLSTPQKRSMADFDEIPEELTPSKQILAESRPSLSPEASVTLNFTPEITQAGDIPTTQPANQQPNLSVHGDWTPSATETVAIKDVVMNNAPTIALPIHEVPRPQQRSQGTVIDISSSSESEPMQPAGRTRITAPRQSQAPIAPMARMAQKSPLTSLEAHAAWLRADPTRRQAKRTPPPTSGVTDTTAQRTAFLSEWQSQSAQRRRARRTPSPTSGASANTAQITTSLPEWQCTEILDFEYHEAKNGEIQRMFAVLWRNNWTQAETRSWEPQAKLPKGMVQAYFDKLNRQAKQQAPQDLPQSERLKQSTLTWGKSQNTTKHAVKQANKRPTAIIADSTSNTKDELD